MEDTRGSSTKRPAAIDGPRRQQIWLSRHGQGGSRAMQRAGRVTRLEIASRLDCLSSGCLQVDLIWLHTFMKLHDQ